MKIYLFIYLMLMFSWLLFSLGIYLIAMKMSFMILYSFYFFFVGFEFLIFIDWMSVLFISVVILVSSMVLIYSLEYVQGEVFGLKFFYLVLMFVFSMILMIISPSILSILLGWDGLGLISYCLVSFYQSINSYKAGILTILMNRVGDVSLMILLVLMFMNNFFFKMFYFLSGDLILVCLVVSAFTKSAQVPFSIWLPAAMAAPTPVSSLVHSSTLVTAGVYLLIRFKILFSLLFLSKLLTVISLMTMIMSGLSALFIYDLKKIIAMSTLSQLGLMFFFLSLGFFNLSFFHLLTHALFKSLMFLCSGIIIHSCSNNQDIRFMGNLILFIPLTSSIFFLSSLILVGFPFFSGFFSKDLMMEMLLMGSSSLLVWTLSLVALSLTVMYSFRLLISLFWVNGKLMNYSSIDSMSLMSYSLFILMMQSIMFGASMNMMLFVGSQVFLKIWFKVLCMLLIIVMIVLSFIFMELEINFKKIFFLWWGMSSMWMMNLMMKYIFFLTYSSSLYIFMFIDKGWNEQMVISGKNYFQVASKIFYLYYLNLFQSLMVVCAYFFIFFVSVL